MTIQEAAKKWVVSTFAVRSRVIDGRISGCTKVPSHSGGQGGYMWLLPDDTPIPADFVIRSNRSNTYKKQLAEAEKLSTDDQVAFVWNNQHASIASIAQALGVPTFRVPILYDLALKRYAGKDPYAPQP